MRNIQESELPAQKSLGGFCAVLYCVFSLKLFPLRKRSVKARSYLKIVTEEDALSREFIASREDVVSHAFNVFFINTLFSALSLFGATTCFWASFFFFFFLFYSLKIYSALDSSKFFVYLFGRYKA